MTTDIRELRIIHGPGTGQLRRAVSAFLREHPLVAKFDTAPQNQGAGGDDCGAEGLMQNSKSKFKPSVNTVAMSSLPRHHTVFAFCISHVEFLMAFSLNASSRT